MGINRQLAENKMILLYIIEKINMPVSNLQITKLILESNFMNYFYLQQSLNELCEDKHLSRSTLNEKAYYTLTANGKQALEYFQGIIPGGIRSRIDSSIASLRKKIKNETRIVADFIPDSENQYVVNCRVHEDDFTLIDLKISVGTRHDAHTICSNWKDHTQEIYAEIIESLTRKRPGRNDPEE